jgi:hypothetical protein
MATTDVLVGYRKADFPRIEAGLKNYLNDELMKIENATTSLREVMAILDTTATPLGNFANDTAAAAGGVPLYGLYHNAGAVRTRLT